VLNTLDSGHAHNLGSSRGNSRYRSESGLRLRCETTKAEVNVLAISSSIHPSRGSNQEVYLANIRLKGNFIQLVKLVDTYSPDSLPIRRAILIERHLLQMTLIRNPQCDSTGLNFFLGSGETNIFDANTRNALNDHPTEMIPCFNVVHEATRLRD
jgi:hypothetical protein